MASNVTWQEKFWRVFVIAAFSISLSLPFVFFSDFVSLVTRAGVCIQGCSVRKFLSLSFVVFGRSIYKILLHWAYFTEIESYYKLGLFMIWFIFYDLMLIGLIFYMRITVYWFLQFSISPTVLLKFTNFSFSSFPCSFAPCSACHHLNVLLPWISISFWKPIVNLTSATISNLIFTMK